MTRDEIATTARSVLETSLGRSIGQTEDVHRSQEPNWDSVRHIEVLFMIEEELGITFAPEDILELDSLKAIVDRAALRLEVP